MNNTSENQKNKAKQTKAERGRVRAKEPFVCEVEGRRVGKVRGRKQPLPQPEALLITTCAHTREKKRGKEEGRKSGLCRECACACKVVVVVCVCGWGGRKGRARILLTNRKTIIEKITPARHTPYLQYGK
jgi:hypothetical protein